MAYRLKFDESAQKGLRRIACEQIDGAETALSNGGSTGVHETRKCLKRIRALLRLMQPGMTPQSFAEENARYRDIGRMLSGTRDKQILLETVLKLQSAQVEPHPALVTLHGIVTEDNEQTSAAALTRAAEALRRLTTARNAARCLKLKPKNFTTVKAGLEANYRKTRKAFDLAYAEPTDEAIHEWRKTIQLHWRHMQLLSRAWPAFFNVRIEIARTLSQMLGEDHDVSVLIAFVNKLPESRFSPQFATNVMALARARQADLRTGARPCGQQLLAQGPGGFAKSVETIWRVGGKIVDKAQSPAAAAVIKLRA